MQDNQYEPFSANEPLISYTPDTIDSISITGKDNGELILNRKSGGWFIAGKDDVPVVLLYLTWCYAAGHFEEVSFAVPSRIEFLFEIEFYRIDEAW